MINSDEFYKEEKLSSIKKKRIWKNIKSEFHGKKFRTEYSFHKISFSLGFAAAFILLFACIGLYSVIRGLMYENTPMNLRINSAYQNVISQLEKNLPETKTSGESIIVDEFIQIKKEELNDIDKAIKVFQNEGYKNDYSRIKQERLRELYKMKLEVLEKIIEMEGNKL